MKHASDVIVPTDTVYAQVVPLSDIPHEWDAAWRELADNASEPDPFAEGWFVRPAIAQLNHGINNRMVGVWQDDVLLGLIALTVAPRYGRMPVAHVENWLHYHCFYGAPLVRAGAEAQFWVALLALLDGAEWAPNFFHLVCIDPDGPVFSGLRSVRRADIVHRSARAMLCSDLDADSYYTTHVRQKKRKELRRLRSRLDEIGTVSFDQFGASCAIDRWIADFIALEASGWKGREGSALGGDARTKVFFEQAIRGANDAGKLDMLRLTLNGEPIAMLINFITVPGGFAFKIAFDEAYARFSPGVLIKIENLKWLDRPGIDWVDSCAVEDHRMINSLWAERRPIVRVTVPLAGTRRKLAFHIARAMENAAAMLRERS